MAVGLNKGHKVTKNTRKPKPSSRKGVSHQQQQHNTYCVRAVFRAGESLVFFIILSVSILSLYYFSPQIFINYNEEIQIT